MRCFWRSGYDSIASCSYGLAKFPTQAKNRADILFKLLRHAMSDLQKDHRLASAIMARMAKWKLLQSVQYLRKVLSIIVAERKVCNGQCYLDEDVDEPDHDCDQVSHVLRLDTCTTFFPLLI